MNKIDYALLTFRPALESDIPFLKGLRDSTMQPHYINTGLVYGNDEQFQRIRDRLDMASIIQYHDTDIGFLKLDRTRSPWELVQIQIAASYQRSGIGTHLLRHIISEAKQNGTDIILDVLKANPAQKLYESVGFLRITEKPYTFIMRKSGL